MFLAYFVCALQRIYQKTGWKRLSCSIGYNINRAKWSEIVVSKSLEIVSSALSVIKILSIRVFDLGLKRVGVVICETREDEYSR